MNGADVKILQNLLLMNILLLMHLIHFTILNLIKNKDKQIRDLKNYILNWNSKKNLILITHFVVISEILNTCC